MKNLLLLVCLLIGMATTMSFTSPAPVNPSNATTVDARAQGSIEWNIEGGLANIVVNGRILVSNASGTGSIAFQEIEGITVEAKPCPGFRIVTHSVSYGSTIEVTATLIEEIK